METINLENYIDGVNPKRTSRFTEILHSTMTSDEASKVLVEVLKDYCQDMNVYNHLLNLGATHQVLLEDFIRSNISSIKQLEESSRKKKEKLEHLLKEKKPITLWDECDCDPEFYRKRIHFWESLCASLAIFL